MSLKNILAAEGLIKSAAPTTDFQTDDGRTVKVPAMVVVKLVGLAAEKNLINQAQRKDIAMARAPIPMRVFDRLKGPEADEFMKAYAKAAPKLPKVKPEKEVDYYALSDKLTDKVYKSGYKSGQSLAGEWYVTNYYAGDPNNFEESIESWATDSGDGWDSDLDQKSRQQALDVMRNLPRYDRPDFRDLYSSGIHSGVVDAWKKIKANPKEYVRLLGVVNLPLGRQVKLRSEDEKRIHELAWNGQMQQAIELLKALNS